MRVIVDDGLVHPDVRPVDLAERKGLGHPDSLADLIADSFSRTYANWCRQAYGVIPNHWVDKVTLVGAASTVTFGGYEIHKPVNAYLFGKITRSLGGNEIPIGGLFQQVVEQTLSAALGDAAILAYVCTEVNNTCGAAVDHDPRFYTPGSVDGLRQVLRQESVANDTVICTGSSSHGAAGRLAVWLETLINGTDFRDRFLMVGSDVKVMVTRVDADLDITAAIPFYPHAVSSWEDYREQLAYVEAALTAELKSYSEQTPRLGAVRLHINTKDAPGRAYLAPFGTSLGKGDCGAVGRGNRYGGVIEPLGPSGCEAPAGKNPLHHAGKIHTALAREAARRIERELGRFAVVAIATRNGEPLGEPALVFISLAGGARASVRREATRITTETITAAPDFHAGFLAADPLTEFHRQAADAR